MAGISFSHKVGKLDLRLPPTQVEWNYQIRTNKVITYGGEVVQVLGISFDRVVFQGRFGKEGAHGKNLIRENNRNTLRNRPVSEYTDWKNPNTTWEIGLSQMAEWFKTYFSSASQGDDARTKFNYDQEPVVVTYQGSYGVPVDANKTQQRWSVYPVSFPSFKRSNEDFAPEWKVECEVYEAPFELKPGDGKYQEVFEEWRRGIGWVPINKFSDPYGEHYDPKNPAASLKKAIAAADTTLEGIVEYYRGIVPVLTPEALEELLLTGASLPNVYNLDKSNRNRENRKNAESAIGGGGVNGGKNAGVAGGETDSAMMDRKNPPPNGVGSNYGKGAAPIMFTGEFAGPGSDNRHDLSYTMRVALDREVYKDSTNQPYDNKGRKI